MPLFTRQHHIPWRLVGLLLLLGALLGVQGLTRPHSHPSSAQALTTSTDVGLILRPHTVRFSGALAGGASIEGTLSPSLPGPNAISLRVILPGGRAARDGRVALTLDMPGMVMRPVRAVLTGSGQGYRGRISLPMFGSYLAQVVAATTLGQYTGTLIISLPLSLGSGTQATR
jgi:hypothetical protein